MTHTASLHRTLAIPLALIATVIVGAHHGSADYHVDREVAVAGGWSAATLKAGETVRLVMYPSRRDGRSGLIKRIERDGGERLLVSRPWLDAR